MNESMYFLLKIRGFSSNRHEIVNSGVYRLPIIDLSTLDCKLKVKEFKTGTGAVCMLKPACPRGLSGKCEISLVIWRNW